MRKLSLDPDDLAVESFEPLAEPSAARGTVKGHASEGTGCDVTQCIGDTCDCPPATNFQQHTCNVLSCGGTCYITCGAECASIVHDVTCGETGCD